MPDVYPRPQLRRSSYICLNGPWDFAVTDGSEPASYFETIRVPYPPEAPLSGINRRIGETETMWYRRSISIPEHGPDECVILHFGAVDQVCEVRLNGTLLGRHEGGYLPFSFTLDGMPNETAQLSVRVVDSLDHRYPWGKQKQSPGGMWYTPFSGIWQTVWMEVVPRDRILSLSLCPSLDAVTVTVVPSAEYLGAVLTVETPNGPISVDMPEPSVTVPIPDPILWTPEHPHLYPITIRCGEDVVSSYFALRTVSQGIVNGVPRLLLNGEPVFLHGLLDQGYWPDGLCLPPDDEGYDRDIRAAKALGFNTLRKHIKIEPLPFYAACDRLGMLVIQDFVNNGSYRFLHDTVLPTVGLKRLSDTNTNGDRDARGIFLKTAQDTIRHLYNAPCIIGWTIFNEGWGQFCADEIYRTLKAFDHTRFFDATSGWFRQKESDVRSEHVYFRKFRLHRSKRPFLLSEFGGYVYAEGSGKRYGYRFFRDRDAYCEAIFALYRDEILPAIPKGLCGAIYTQLSDVEEEQNGLLRYDRSSVKPDPERMTALAGMLAQAMRNKGK